jgi:hypothetical protein
MAPEALLKGMGVTIMGPMRLRTQGYGVDSEQEQNVRCENAFRRWAAE